MDCEGRRSRRRPGWGCRGFTVVDIVVTMLVFVIIVGISIPGVNSLMRSHQFRSSLDLVTSRLFLARQMAVQDAFPYVVTLDVPNRQLALFGDPNGNGALDAGEPTLGPWQMNPGISLANVSWTTGQLSFFPNGGVSESADLRVISTDGRDRTVRVSSMTGNAEVLP